MVSTRGVKFKFEKMEIVLCYEPDPTKAKVLYESKVLDVGIRKDKFGRKTAEYLVHFNGWNSSWDRFVSEELILEDNEENRALQQHLAQQAIVKLKSNKKRKLIEALLTDKRSKRKRNMGQMMKFRPQKDRPKRTLSCGKSVKLNILDTLLIIPDTLKRQLENDYLFVKNYDKLVRLPCEPNVIFILEDYVQRYVQNSVKHENCDKRLNLCKEMVDGLRIYFDFTLSNLLLYNSEMKQFEYLTSKRDFIYKKNLTILTCDMKREKMAKNVLQSTQEEDENASLKSDEESMLDRTLPLNDSMLDNTLIDKDNISTTSTKQMDSPRIKSIFGDSSVKRCRYCQETLNWNLLPQSVYDHEPTVPSLVYGAHHLLRLFVKLPELLSRSNMPLKKLQLLGQHLQDFLRYLDEKRDDLFHDSDYVDLNNSSSLVR